MAVNEIALITELPISVIPYREDYPHLKGYNRLKVILGHTIDSEETELLIIIGDTNVDQSQVGAIRYRQQGNIVLVEFFSIPSVAPIWDALIKDMPCELFEAEPSEQPIDELLPKKPATLAKWKTAYSVMVEMDREYAEAYTDGDTDEPNPTYEEYRERLRTKHGLKYSDKRLRHIKKVGKDGKLR
jgi:hypothetical protein